MKLPKLNTRGAAHLIVPIIVVLCVVAVGAYIIVKSHADSCLATASASCSTSSVKPVLAVHISDGKLVNAVGRPIRLVGLDASGTEDACIQDKGLSWDSIGTAEAAAIASWHVNVVRIPLNEDCWLGINGAPTAYSGATYQAAIKTWVRALNKDGIIAILDLHWAAPSTYPATQQWPMADADHSITFWSQVASVYKSDPAIIFDLFNEPYLGKNAATEISWQCWLNGCNNSTYQGVVNGSTATIKYSTAGMQQMLDAVRYAGALQPVMIGGLRYSGDPCAEYESDGSDGCREIANMPKDPDQQLAISYHAYSGQGCDTLACWNTLDEQATEAKLPIITGEIGDTDGKAGYISAYMAWADTHDVSYLAWSWSAGTSQFDLNANWTGTPNPPEGTVYKAHLAALASE